MSTTYNIEIREFNGTDYDILYPITTIANVNGLTTSLDELSTIINGKANVSDLGTLAGKDSISLTSDVTGTLPIANGGTGATTAANARTNLGLGSLATKSTVTLTSDVTGALPIANGGTGATTAAAARNALGLGNTTGALPIANGGTNASTAANARTNLGITAIAVRPDYQISTTDLGENQTLSAGKIYFYVGS